MYYDLNIASEIPLLNKPSFINNINFDVNVYLDTRLKAPNSKTQVTDKESIFYRRQDVGIFEIIQGKEIRVKVNEGVIDQEVARILLGLPMGYLLMQRGLHVLHASVVNIDGLAAAFLGLSGSGKSTMASSFLQNNHSLLTEDIAAVNLSNLMVTPAFPSLKIGQDTLDQLDLPTRELKVAAADSRNRLIYEMDEKQFCKQPTKLKNCYLLEWGDQLSIEPVEAKQAFFDLFPHTFRPITDTGSEELDIESFKKMTDFSNKVSVYKLTRPKSFASLDDCRVLVEEHMQQT